MIVRALSALLGGALLLVSGVALAADRTETIAGWTLRDTGRKPGDDSERQLLIRRAVPGVDLSYRPSELNSGGSLQINFGQISVGRCRSFSYSSGFGFEDPPADRATQVRAQIHEALADFAQDCPAFKLAATEAALMEGFAQAFAAVDKVIAEQPFVYPPDAPDAEASSGAGERT